MVDSSEVFRAKVLVVDDQEANVLLLQRLLAGAGYVAVSATMNPTEVRALHLANHYDLILLDLHMPEMDGFQVLEALQALETEGDLTVLVLTAQPDHKSRALKAGAKDFISKPFDRAEVLMRVHNLLEIRLLRRETARLSGQLVAQQAISERLCSMRCRSSSSTSRKRRSCSPTSEGSPSARRG